MPLQQQQGLGIISKSSNRIDYRVNQIFKNFAKFLFDAITVTWSRPIHAVSVIQSDLVLRKDYYFNFCLQNTKLAADNIPCSHQKSPWLITAPAAALGSKKSNEFNNIWGIKGLHCGLVWSEWLPSYSRHYGRNCGIEVPALHTQPTEDRDDLWSIKRSSTHSV